MASFPNSDVATLRRLLVLARDLLQTRDLDAVLRLVGPALLDLSSPDAALLLVQLGPEQLAAAFDANGLRQPKDEGSVLYQHSQQALLDGVPQMLPVVGIDHAPRTSTRSFPQTASLLAIPFPSIRPVGVLSALWLRDGNPDSLASHASVLRQVSELTGAALSNVNSNLALEERISVRNAEARVATQAHANELQRRDGIEREKDRIAVPDVLTGMLNRRGFFLHAEQVFKVARRQGTPSAVIFVDIDGLKMVNDQLGHDYGDQLIQSAAAILRQSFRDSDVVARLGGDEFAAFALNAGKPEAILARIHELIEQNRRNASMPYDVSFSVGIVPCDPTSTFTLAEYLSIADQKMYEQKKLRP